MPYLSGNIEAAGAVIDVVIGVPQSRAALLQKHSFVVPPPVDVRALIDTGSFMSGFILACFETSTSKHSTTSPS